MMTDKDHDETSRIIGNNVGKAAALMLRLGNIIIAAASKDLSKGMQF